MKALKPITNKVTAPVPAPVKVAVPTGTRPARRGHFWPGETAIKHNQRWIECGALAEQPFALPPFIGGGGS
jgi:hypothetical protein